MDIIPNPPKLPEKKGKFKIPNRLIMPLFYIGIAILILIVGLFIPGIADEIVLESAWILVVAGFEIWKKFQSRK